MKLLDPFTNLKGCTKLKWLHHWCLGMDKSFHSILYNRCNYLYMHGLKLNHASNIGPRPQYVNPSSALSFMKPKHPHHWLRISRHLTVPGHQQENANKTWWHHQMETFSALLAFCVGNSRWPVNSPQKGQWSRALMFSLICAWTDSWANNGDAGDLRRYRVHYDIIVMKLCTILTMEQSQEIQG